MPFTEKKRFLVTGGLGFIGSNLATTLINEGHTVIVFDNETSGHNHQEGERLHTIIGDITLTEDWDKVRAFIATDPEKWSPDYVAHLAAVVSVAESMTNEEKYMHINKNGSKHVLDFCVSCKSVKKVVAAGTAAYYGDRNGVACEESMEYKGISPYAKAKYEMVKLFEQYDKEHEDLVCGITRFFNVYGPRQDPKSAYSGVISKFFEFATTNQDLTIFGDGKNTRDFVFVQDIIQGILLFLLKGEKFGVYNLGTEIKTTLNDLAALIIKKAGSTSKIVHKDAREGDIIHSVSCTKKVRETFGFKPKYSLEEGMQLTMNWFQDVQKQKAK